MARGISMVSGVGVHTDVALHEATEADRPVLENLRVYFRYDLSEFLGWRCPETGVFSGSSEYLQRYFDDGPHFPFLIRCSEELAGYALIDGNQYGDSPDFSVGAFFVLRKFRGRGVARQAAVQLFDSFRGRWSVDQLMANTPAVSFWRRVVTIYTDGDYEERYDTSNEGPTSLLVFRNDGSQYD